MRKYASLLPFLLLVAAISALGSYYTMPAVQSWYQTINKAAWTPPNWVFGPVWTTLYIMIAVSGWRVWRKLQGTLAQKIAHPTLRAYWVQLFLNNSWSIMFFGYAQFTVAAFVILAMLVAIMLNIKSFKRIDTTAARLLIPYGAWVAYASSLNIAIATLN